MNEGRPVRLIQLLSNATLSLNSPFDPGGRVSEAIPLCLVPFEIFCITARYQHEVPKGSCCQLFCNSFTAKKNVKFMLRHKKICKLKAM